MERLARLFVGIGFVWVAIMLLWGLMAGVDQPYAWFKWAADSSGYIWMRPTWLALTLFVVPIGMLTFLRDIFGDPVAPWVKWAAPGVFLVIFAFFLLIAQPDFGAPLFSLIESVVNPGGAMPSPGKPGSTQSWLIRVAITLGVWGGVPGVIGGFVGMMTGSSKAGSGRR
jgi:hypothetical protein